MHATSTSHLINYLTEYTNFGFTNLHFSSILLKLYAKPVSTIDNLFYKLTLPIKFNKSLNLIASKGFVSISTRFTSDRIFTTLTTPILVSSLIMCILTLICFVLSWYLVFLLSCVALELSQQTVTVCYPKPNSKTMTFHRSAFSTGSVNVRYSASVLERVTTNFNYAFQLIAPPHTMNIKPVKDLLCVNHLHSQYLHNQQLRLFPHQLFHIEFQIILFL